MNYTPLIFILLFNLSYGQSLTVKDLLNLKNLNFDQKETAILEKGFLPDSQDNGIKGYNKGEFKNNLGTCPVEILSVGKYTLIYGITNTKVYINLKKQLVENGYKFVETKNEIKNGKPRIIKVYRKDFGGLIELSDFKNNLNVVYYQLTLSF